MSEDGAKESNIERNMETEIPFGLIVQKFLPGLEYQRESPHWNERDESF